MKAAILTLLFCVMMAGVTYAQYGYGTSSITLSKYAVTLINGGTANVNYTVALASGNTWGTTIAVNNAQQLLSNGIVTSLSKTSANPTFSGVLNINVAPSTTKGTYQIVLSATGDDPSTSNVTLVLNIIAPGQTTTTVAQSNTPTTTSVAASTTTAPYQTTSAYKYSNSSYSMNELLMIGGIILVLIIAGALMLAFKSMYTRMDILGIAFIVIGTIVWLYGDYSFSLTALWAGVGVLILGALVWLVADVMAGAFKAATTNAALIAFGFVLILVGTGVWLYADLHGGNILEIWAGVAVIGLGTLVWLIGNALSGAFRRAKK